MPHQTQGRHQDGVRRNGKYWSHQKGQRAHRLGEQCRLQPKIKWPFAHLPRSKGLELCNQEKSPCHPTLEELTHKFAGRTIFSKVDARHGYWSVALDEESSMLTTFNSPFGRYRYLRMPFGLRMSQDVFQQKMDQILESCPGCIYRHSRRCSCLRSKCRGT